MWNKFFQQLLSISRFIFCNVLRQNKRIWWWRKSPWMVSLFHYLKLYFLLAGWSVRLVKNCDRGLANAAFTLRPRAAFSSLRSRFFTLRTDPEPFLSAVNWLTSGFSYATLSFNRLTRRLQNRFISNYFMLFAFSSTVKFSKIVFPVWNFVQSLKYFVLRTEIITVSRCESLDLRLFFSSNWVSDSVEIR